MSDVGAKKPKLKIDGEKLRDRARRTVILGAVIAFLVGSVGIYIFMVIQSGQNSTTDTTQAQQQPKKQLQTDPNAYKTSEKVTKLQVTDLKKGSGKTVKPGDTVTVSYEGTLATSGKIFDQSSKPISISLSQVIPGWQKGIPGMKVGGERRLVIPAAMGYGTQGSSDGSIPPGSDLVFTVTVTSVK